MIGLLGMLRSTRHGEMRCEHSVAKEIGEDARLEAPYPIDSDCYIIVAP